MTRKPKVGDLVLTGSHLTSIQRVGKLHRSEGAWHFMRSDTGGWSPYLHFSQDWTITYAELDVTVCRVPWGAGHRCGLTHLPADELAQLTGKPVETPASGGITTVKTILDGESQ